MREIIFDTETTGLDPREDRIIEIGGIELVNRFPTGRSFHFYLDPDGRSIHPDAQAVHGISAADLVGKPKFAAIAAEFLAFTENASLVAHNAGFDMGFVNAELARLGLSAFPQERVVDTLFLARRKHPMGPNSLDALCKRYSIDNARRVKHGALLDSELLAEVYIELIGGKQATFGLEIASATVEIVDGGAMAARQLGERPRPLPPRLSEAELSAHEAMVAALGEAALWNAARPGKG